jgi:hypothetical protein
MGAMSIALFVHSQGDMQVIDFFMNRLPANWQSPD